MARKLGLASGLILVLGIMLGYCSCQPFSWSRYALAESSRRFPSVEQLPARPELPDPLVMLDGTKIANREDWLQKRVPELKELFQHYMYGYLPPAVPVQGKELFCEPRWLGGQATLREVALTIGNPPLCTVHVLLAVPNRREGPVPVFVGMNFCGNHAVVDDRRVRVPTAWMYPNRKGVVNHRATESGRGSDTAAWNLDLAMSRGYAVATFYCGEIQPDDPKATEGMLVEWRQGRTPAAHDPGTIAAWAWGIHRVVDYLQTVPELDHKRLAVVGHSRLGKTALLAGAFDERIALIIPHQAGCGGTAPSRGKVGESVRAINDRFPHWFNANFKRFNDQPERLPFDQHCLIALCAPRPVLLTNAVEDTWANPAGQFEMLVAAEPVYRLFGVEGLGQPGGDGQPPTAADQMPLPGRLIGHRLGYWIRPGKHSMTREDWEIFLRFADKHLK